ncbi:hypothetical protein [Thalassotalea litorea]|uniref:hypothetical protein n=1 Tax=Thalassotalea litorea TaxID=2020715 RepID=UPI003735103A
MDRKVILGISTALILSLNNSLAQETVVNHEAPGNLESLSPSGCVAVNDLSNMQNPVDIFTGVNICLVEENYPNAAELYFAGMSYGFFDTKRVSDKTAHQAISVLRMNLFSDKGTDVTNKLQDAVTDITSDNKAICESLSNLGAPAYVPTYMIQHGMGAFTGDNENKGLVEDFDSEMAWRDVLATIVKCNKA